jgi:hypothetical protein
MLFCFATQFEYLHSPFHREQMSERADAVAARTTTVHGNLGEKSVGAAEYHAALSRLRCSRGDTAPYVPGHCFFSSVAFSSPITSSYSSLPWKMHFNVSRADAELVARRSCYFNHFRGAWLYT